MGPDGRQLYANSFDGIDPKTTPFLDVYDHPPEIIERSQSDVVFPFTDQTLRCAQSISKSYVGYTFWKVLKDYNRLMPEQENIQLTDSISILIPELGSTSITVLDVLNMRVPIDLDVKNDDGTKKEFTDPNHPLRHMLRQKSPVQGHVIPRLHNVPIQHDKSFNYTGSMTVLLWECTKRLAETISEKDPTYPTKVEELVSTVLGKDIHWYTWKASGMPSPTSGVHLSHQDFVGVTATIAKDKAFLEAVMQHKQDAHVTGQPPQIDDAYGLQCWVLDHPDTDGITEIAMIGNGGQRASIFIKVRGLGHHKRIDVHGISCINAGNYFVRGLQQQLPSGVLMKDYILPILNAR